MLKTLLSLVIFAGLAAAQSDALLKEMRSAETAWNRGDLAAFVTSYEDSPDTTFIGREITRGGVKALLDRYRRGYPTQEKMGTLTYSEMQVRPIADNIAIMTGHFALKRTAAGGGDASGIFTLIWKRTPAGWKIIHDHTH